MSNYEEEQEKLRKLWAEADSDEEQDDEEELAFEEDLVESQSTDSESEQECDYGSDDNIPLTKLPRIPTLIGKDGTML